MPKSKWGNCSRRSSVSNCFDCKCDDPPTAFYHQHKWVPSCSITPTAYAGTNRGEKEDVVSPVTRLGPVIHDCVSWLHKCATCFTIVSRVTRLDPVIHDWVYWLHECVSCYTIVYLVLHDCVSRVTRLCISCYTIVYLELHDCVSRVTRMCISCYVTVYLLLHDCIYIVTRLCHEFHDCVSCYTILSRVTRLGPVIHDCVSWLHECVSCYTIMSLDYAIVSCITRLCTSCYTIVYLVLHNCVSRDPIV